MISQHWIIMKIQFTSMIYYPSEEITEQIAIDCHPMAISVTRWGDDVSFFDSSVKSNVEVCNFEREQVGEHTQDGIQLPKWL